MLVKGGQVPPRNSRHFKSSKYFFSTLPDFPHQGISCVQSRCRATPLLPVVFTRSRIDCAGGSHFRSVDHSAAGI